MNEKERESAFSGSLAGANELGEWKPWPEEPDVFCTDRLTEQDGLSSCNGGWHHGPGLRAMLHTSQGHPVFVVAILHHEVGTFSLIVHDNRGRKWLSEGPRTVMRLVKNAADECFAHEMLCGPD